MNEAKKIAADLGAATGSRIIITASLSEAGWDAELYLVTPDGDTKLNPIEATLVVAGLKAVNDKTVEWSEKYAGGVLGGS